MNTVTGDFESIIFLKNPSFKLQYDISSPCDGSCASCDGPSYTNCLKCRPSLFLNPDFTCKNSCADKYFMDTGSNLCKPCHYTCLSCDSYTFDGCLSCPSVAYLQFNQTSRTCGCQSNSYLLGTECIPCLDKCATCSNQIDCLTCATGYYNAPTCPACDDSCENCAVTKTKCTSCNIKLNRVDKSLVDNTCPCVDGYGPDGKKCSKCHYSCQTCSGLTEKDCLTCPDFKVSKRFFNAGKCPCQNGLMEYNNQVMCIRAEEQSKCLQGAVGGMGISTLLAILPTFIFGNPQIILQILDILQEIRYVLYLNVGYPGILNSFFDLFNIFSFSFIPNMVQDGENEMQATYGFERNRTDSLFLRNASPQLVMLGLSIIFYLLVKALEYFTRGAKENHFFRQKLTKVIKMMEWGFFMGLLESAYLDLSAFSCLQLQNSSNTTSLQIFSYFLAFFFFLAVIVFPCFVFYVSYVAHNKKTEDLDNFNEKYGLVYNFFRAGKIIQTSFYLVILGRKFIFVFFLVFVWKQPYVVITFWIINALVVLVITIIYNPYKELIFFIRDIIQECCFILIYILIYPLVGESMQDQNKRRNIGLAMIAFIIIVLLAHFSAIAYEQWENFKEIREWWRNRNKKKLPEPVVYEAPQINYVKRPENKPINKKGYFKRTIKQQYENENQQIDELAREQNIVILEQPSNKANQRYKQNSAEPNFNEKANESKLIELNQDRSNIIDRSALDQQLDISLQAEQEKPNPMGEQEKPNPMGEQEKPNPMGEQEKPNPMGEQEKPNPSQFSSQISKFLAIKKVVKKKQ